MTSDSSFPALSPEMARERFLIRDASWSDRFKANFNQFIVTRLEEAWQIIKLPLPPSRTSNHMVLLVTEGYAELTVGHQVYGLPARSLVIVPALQIFTIQSIREDATGFMSLFSQELVLSATTDADFDFLKLTGQPLILLSDNQTHYISRVLDRLTHEYVENGSAKTDLIRPYLAALLVEIDRAYVGTVPTKADSGDRLVQGFMDLLTIHARENRFVSYYADRLHVSPNHLNKVIKNRTGQSPSAWIDQRLVLEAKVLLFQSDLSIAQIAHELGFDDQSNFGKLFRKHTQLKPTDFRSRARTND